MSFQITILKVLAGHPEGRVSLPELTRFVSILMSSGPDWSNRTKAMAARVPELNIFGDSFVIRDDAGWQITDGGRAFLEGLEKRPTELAHCSDRLKNESSETSSRPPLLRLVIDNSDRNERGHDGNLPGRARLASSANSSATITA